MTAVCPACNGSALAALCGRTDLGSDGPCVMRAGHIDDRSPCWGENDVAGSWEPAMTCLTCCVCPCGATNDGTECPYCHVSMTPGQVTADPTPEGDQ